MTAGILITGATGTVGKELVDRMSRMGVAVRIGIHSPRWFDDARFIARDIERVPFDFDDPAMIDRALEGIDKVFLLTPPGRYQADQVGRFMERAVRHTVSHIVRHSMIGVGYTPVIALSRVHREAEDIISSSSIPWTFLRPNSFMQNIMQYIQPESGMIYLPLGNGSVSYVDARDVAACAVEILLTTTQHYGKTYVPTGMQALSMTEIARIISEVTGKHIEYTDISEDAARHALESSGMSAWDIDAVLEFDAMNRNSVFAGVTNDVHELTAFEPVPFTDYVRDVAPVIRNIVSKP
jgi:uncharacterized protein YbjT (DUF2867 family)